MQILRRSKKRIGEKTNPKTAKGLARYQVDTGEVRQTLEKNVWGEDKINASEVANALLDYIKLGMRRETKNDKSKTLYAPVLIYGAIVNDIEVFENETDAIDYFCEAMKDEFGQYMLKLANGHWKVPNWEKLNDAIGEDEMSSGSTIYHLELHQRTRSAEDQAKEVIKKMAERFPETKLPDK